MTPETAADIVIVVLLLAVVVLVFACGVTVGESGVIRGW